MSSALLNVTTREGKRKTEGQCSSRSLLRSATIIYTEKEGKTEIIPEIGPCTPRNTEILPEDYVYHRASY